MTTTGVGAGFGAGEAAGRFPRVDLTAPREAIVAGIDAAGRDLGFFVLTGHGLPAATFAALRASAVGFFELGDAEKARVARPSAATSRGWNRFADQSNGATKGGPAIADLQESFAIGRPDAAPADGGPGNLWPQRPVGFTPALTGAYAALADLSGRLFTLMAAAVGLPEPDAVRAHAGHASILRIVHYPPVAAGAASGALRAGAHTDFGTLTILSTDSTPGGLEVRDADGTWHPVVPRPGELIVNIGDLMQRWSGDRWRSSLHRVVPPPGEAGEDGRRLSIVFFHEPDPTTVVTPVDPAGAVAAAYPPITAGAYRRAKVAQLRGV